MDVSLSTSSVGLLRTSSPSVKTGITDTAVNSGGSTTATTATAAASNMTAQAVQPVSNTDTGNQSQTDANNKQSLADAISSVEDFVQNMNRDLEFNLDKTSGEVIVKIVDRSSGDVIRQIPSEDMLKLASRLKEARSLLFESKA